MWPIVPMLQCGFVRLNLALPIAAAFHEKEDQDLVQTLWQSAGAGDGNRTHIASLEGWSSTIELHPPVHLFSPPRPCQCAAPPPEPTRRPPRFLAIAQRWWRGYPYIVRSATSTTVHKR